MFESCTRRNIYCYARQYLYQYIRLLKHVSATFSIWFILLVSAGLIFFNQIIHHIYQKLNKINILLPILENPKFKYFYTTYAEPAELQKVDVFQSEEIALLKNRSKYCIGKITKVVNRITDLIDKQAVFSNIDSCNK